MQETWSHLLADYCFERSLWHGTGKTNPYTVTRDHNCKPYVVGYICSWLPYVVGYRNRQLIMCMSTCKSGGVHVMQAFVAIMGIVAADMAAEHT